MPFYRRNLYFKTAMHIKSATKLPSGETHKNMMEISVFSLHENVSANC